MQNTTGKKTQRAKVGGKQICKELAGTQLCPSTFLHIKSRLRIFNPGNLYLLEQINNLHVHHAFLHLGRMFRTRCFLNLGTAQIGLIGSKLVCHKQSFELPGYCIFRACFHLLLVRSCLVDNVQSSSLVDRADSDSYWVDTLASPDNL